MHPDHNIKKTDIHFSFLRETRVHGIYFNSIKSYINSYPFVRKNHSYDFYSVIFFTKGEGIYKINDDAYPVKPQTVSLIAPGQVHSFESLEKTDGFVFFFCQDFYVEEFSFVRLLNVYSYTSRIGKILSNPCISLSDEEYGPIISNLNSIRNEYEAHTTCNNTAIVIRSLLNIILLKLSSLYEAKSAKHHKTNNVLIHSLANLVDSNFIEEQHIGFYTSSFNISERQLNEICNKYFNCGLKKILQDRLMQEARKLLMSSEYSVAEIAYKLNFEDNSYFNKVFKNKVGLTPGRFREMHRRLVPQNP